MLDFTKSPYRAYVELLHDLRESDAARERVELREVHHDARGTHDANELERARLAHILLLEPQPIDPDLLRFLLDQEIAARRCDDFLGAGDTLTILSMLLHAHADASDTRRFWQAKRANFDTWAGGYDIEHVFASRPADEVLRTIGEHSRQDVELIEKHYDVPSILEELDEWRQSLARRFPRRIEDLTVADCEHWAELFGDREGRERFGELAASSPEDRARLYRDLDRHADAVTEWRTAAAATTDPWDRTSLLRNALTDAAKVPLAMRDEVQEIDELRPQIPSWSEVGLGRMTTQACYELAAAVEDASTGPWLWSMAERWRSGLTSFPLVGLQVALEAARRWGTPAEVEGLEHAVATEQARIDALLAD